MHLWSLGSFICHGRKTQTPVVKHHNHNKLYKSLLYIYIHLLKTFHPSIINFVASVCSRFFLYYSLFFSHDYSHLIINKLKIWYNVSVPFVYHSVVIAFNIMANRTLYIFFCYFHSRLSPFSFITLFLHLLSTPLIVLSGQLHNIQTHTLEE